ncbi:MAG: orotate phosphoribosyltransferase [Thermoguttaceae bacterium]|nr:orotate phosphoribosyltransferase [Thermoguttaceae bacterium]MBQ9455015.1 orotate phosphoribosyltransferase [Thermoguttaceae bacterium]MDO4857075.1 orotate phosphoribosyltransferase [Thermoguttaceae bacterium]
MYNSDELKQLLLDRALKFGDFILASGKKAKYYCDSKQITLSSKVRLVGEGMLKLMEEEGEFPDAVGGMTMGADPIVASIITMADVQGKNLKGFLVRKEAKGHGTNKFVEGPVQPGESVIIVEDVVTTGGSSLKAIERAVEFGLKVKAVYAILDRMEGGREAFENAGYKLKSLFTIRDFGIEPPQE